MSRIAIIAALERELQPLVRNWTSVTIRHNGRSLRGYESGELIAVASGIGSHNAEATAQTLVDKYRPELLISAGLGGALIRSLKVGNVFLPGVVVDAATGAEYRCAPGGDFIIGGVLVTAAEIASATSKQDLVSRFHGLVVDMEASGVARAAQAAGIGFLCVKAISDEADFAMPPLSRFVDAGGQFKSGKFAAWVALRPQYWPAVIALARNSKRAVLALCAWLQHNVTSNFKPAAVTLERTELSRAKN